MKIFIIPEDQELDQYIVKPILERILSDIGRTARIDVLPKPRMRGISHLMGPGVIEDIVEDYPMADLFVVMVDSDCDYQNRGEKIKALVERQPAARDGKKRLIACIAREEIEVWMLGLHHRDPALGAAWQDIRAHCHPKEAFAEPFIARKGWSTLLGRGRKHAMRELGQHWSGLLGRCDELAQLRREIQAWIEAEG